MMSKLSKNVALTIILKLKEKGDFSTFTLQNDSIYKEKSQESANTVLKLSIFIECTQLECNLSCLITIDTIFVLTYIFTGMHNQPRCEKVT